MTPMFTSHPVEKHKPLGHVSFCSVIFSSVSVRNCTKRGLDYLKKLGQDFWKETVLLSFSLYSLYCRSERHK